MKLFSICMARTAMLLALWMSPSLWAQDNNGAWRFVTNGPESPDDQRYAYHWRVLKAALEVTKPAYGDYSMTTAPYMNESRQVVEMKTPSSELNTLVLDSTKELERDLIPVKIPIDKGFLGYRVFLIRAEDQSRFSAVRGLDDLRHLRIGQGSDWSDVAIYREAGFRVEVGTAYEGLFGMLMSKRFDAFGRGVTEVQDELKARQAKYPGMAIEKNLLLYYPMPVYFWFPKTDTGRRYAKRVKDGMHMLVQDGTLDRMFKENFSPLIKELNLKKRLVLRIPHNALPGDQPFKDARLWYDPLR